MEKIFKLTSIAFLMILSLGLASCDKDEEDTNLPEDNRPNETVDYSKKIAGHWANINVADDVMETLSFDNRNGETSFFDLIDQEFGVMAFGTYTLNADKITSVYTRISVYTETGSSTYHGFTEGQTKKVVYTIQSCDGKKLSLKTESGQTLTYEKYAELN